MKIVIIFKSFPYGIIGGIYEGIKYEEFNDEYGPAKDKVLYYIPLTVTGKTYKDKREDLRNKAIKYQAAYSDYCDLSYGEISTITEFFELNARRYGLLTEFKNEGII